MNVNLFNPTQVVLAMKVLYLQPHNRFGAETAHHSWAADVKKMYDWLPQHAHNIIKVTIEEIKCFQMLTCEKAGSISKIYLLKGDEIGNNSSFSGKMFTFQGHVHMIKNHQT